MTLTIASANHVHETYGISPTPWFNTLIGLYALVDEDEEVKVEHT